MKYFEPYMDGLAQETKPQLWRDFVGSVMRGEEYELPVTVPTAIEFTPEARNTLIGVVAGLGLAAITVALIVRKR